ncbi:MAG: amino acid ABC transporter permease [Acetobacteraceae bacterium]
MDLHVLWHYAPALLSGFAVTILCWGLGSLIGLVPGFAVALLYRLPLPALRWSQHCYIEVIRGTPFLVQLFLLYSGGPFIGVRLSAVTAGIVGLGVYAAAYFAELFRAGFAAVPRGHREAAMSLGISPLDILARRTLPGMLVAIVPALVNMLIILAKKTVVLSIITVPEPMYQVETMAAQTFSAFSSIFAVAVLYWLLVEAVSHLGRRAGQRVTAFLGARAA